MTDKPKALRLANLVDYGSDSTQLEREIAAELRRLHAVNAELLEALQFCAGTSYIDDAHRVAQQAIARAEDKT